MAVACLRVNAARADELLLPKAVNRDGPIPVVYRFDHPVTGRGHLEAEWTDADGRLVERRLIPVYLAGARAVQFTLDAGKAVAVKNEVSVHISLKENDGSGAQVHQTYDAHTRLIIPPPHGAWSDYQIIMWQRQTTAGYAALKRLGVTGGMVMSDRFARLGQQVMRQVETRLDAGVRFYLENTATDFYSAYHRWSPGRPVNWRFLAAKRQYWANPRDLEAFFRKPSLSDPAWIKRIGARLTNDVRALRRYRPLFYDLGDEPGIADLTAFWDFDFSPPSLAGMRRWLRARYGNLMSLNKEWGSAFRTWNAVVPMTTNEALMRADENFAAWGDFKEWMDVAFARALRHGRDAVHAADPKALAAIEGGQLPGWGGYDYWRLASSVDAMELGDGGENVEMLRSFNPKMVMLTTAFHGGPAEEHRVWRELLRGTRGLILWDPKHQFVDQDGQIGDRGRDAAPYFHELRDGLGALVINSQRHQDPIAILYSPASMRIEWLLDRRHSGKDWTRRSAETEDEDNRIRASIRGFTRAIEHMGLQPRFVSSQEVESGDLTRGHYRVLILPETIALSERAAAIIRKFTRDGGTVIADGEPAIFDQHGRHLKVPALAAMFSYQSAGDAADSAFGRGHAIALTAPAPGDRDAIAHLRELLAKASLKPMIPLVRGNGKPPDDVQTYVFRNGGVTIVAFLRDLDSASAAPAPEALEAELPHSYYAYDLRKSRPLGLATKLPIAVGSVAPVVLVLSKLPLPELSISGPTSIEAGAGADFRISPDRPSPAACDILHVEVLDPGGHAIPYYSGNLLARGANASYRLPLAINDKPGTWTIRVYDLLAGATVTAHLQVRH